jgi:hypothetical protein
VRSRQVCMAVSMAHAEAITLFCAFASRATTGSIGHYDAVARVQGLFAGRWPRRMISGIEDPYRK